MQRAMHATVDEVGRVVAAEGIDAQYAKGGTITLARTAAAGAAAVATSSPSRASFGFGDGRTCDG